MDVCVYQHMCLYVHRPTFKLTVIGSNPLMEGCFECNV